MRILNDSRKTIIAADAGVADTPGTRLKGLLGRTSLNHPEALIITQCRQIHMFFMKFPIDVIFVDKKGFVVGLVKNIKPFRLGPYFFRASYAIECPCGTIAKTKTMIKDKILIEE